MRSRIVKVVPTGNSRTAADADEIGGGGRLKRPRGAAAQGLLAQADHGNLLRLNQGINMATVAINRPFRC